MVWLLLLLLLLLLPLLLIEVESITTDVGEEVLDEEIVTLVKADFFSGVLEEIVVVR